MPQPNDRFDQKRALAEARRQGTLHAMRWALGAAAAILVLLIATAAAGWTLASRAQDAAPLVIEEIAAERQSAMETTISTRSQEAQLLVVDMIGFLKRVWQENESLERVRWNLDAATGQMRLLTAEVNAAFDSPTKNLGTLFDNGPTRARAVLDHAVAVAKELQRLVPVVLEGLNQAKDAAAAAHGLELGAMLDSMRALLEPFIGENQALKEQWIALKGDVLGWSERVSEDLGRARAAVSGDELSDEFLRRLRLHVF